MMTLKNKGQELIYLLLTQRDFMTSDVLAQKLQTSTKTIYRWVKSINEDLSNGPLIISEKGKGYKLDYDQYLLLDKAGSPAEYSPKQRRSKLKQLLLLQAPQPVSVFDLMAELFVGESVLVSDEKLIAQDLKKFDLQLIRKKRTLAIQGKEENIRHAILEGLQHDQIVDFIDLKVHSDLNIDEKDAAFILYQLEFIERKLSSSIPYPYNINIFLHLYILMQRIRKSQTHLADGGKENLEDASAILLESATEVIQHLETYLDLPIPKIEVHYLYQYLSASRLQETSSKEILFSEKVKMITQTYLKLMNQKWPFDINNKDIFIDLANHIEPMLKRLKQKIMIHNGLLNQIKLIYSEIFERVCQTSHEISQLYQLSPISDDENGFITLYFAKLLETSSRKLKTLIVCTTGIGISELLRAKISNSFSDLEIVDVIASRETKHLEENYPAIDLLISTIPLQLPASYPFLLVSGMFTLEDQERLRQKIGEIKNEQ
ncbi:BglG family transcription antiterminator [Streptococcus dentapri]|uniref:BglG family transcription antiterminator n=1 Tax=Streptococcus dentapri TaxID=573564 RepID=A0ABV8D374_9STRE